MLQQITQILLSPAGLAASVGSAVGVVLLAVGFRMIRPNLAKNSATEGVDKGESPFAEKKTENRRAPRRKGKCVVVDLLDRTDENRQWKGWVIDRSKIGLCLGSDEKVKPGETVRVRVTEHAQFMPWIDIEVRRCEPGYQGYELGCKFVEMPNWNLLLTFG